MSRPLRIGIIVCWVALLIPVSGWCQFDIPPKPARSQQTAVYDYIELLTESQQRSLETKLVNYADSTSTQIVIVIISSTKGEDISFLGAKWGQKWGVGQAGEDNGIMILLARDDRRVDINTGYGIEYRITDRMAERIINNYMIPAFKKGDYYGGLDAGTEVIIKMLEGEFKATEIPKKDSIRGVLIGLFFLLFLIIFISSRRRGRGGNGGRGRLEGPSIWDMIILSNAGRTGGWGSSSGGSFGGGGFGGGFGGGSFGGGGASGGW